MHYLVKLSTLMIVLVNFTKSESDLCGLENTLARTWIGRSQGNTDPDRLVVNGDDIVLTVGGVKYEYRCEDRGAYYGEYLWLTKNGRGYLCVWKGILEHTIATSTGNFKPTHLPKKTDPTFLNLCKEEDGKSVMKLRIEK